MIDRQYPAWLKAHGTPDAPTWAARLQAIAPAPAISVVMPVHDTRPDWLDSAVASVRTQFHPGWELLIADDASASAAVRNILARAVASDPRIRLVRLEMQGGISAASNAALAIARHPYVTFLDHDDCLAPHALAAMACELAAHTQAALVFSDEDQLVGRRRVRPYFKPGWNPDLLLSQNLVCHLAVYRLDLVRRLGGLRSTFDGSQDFDLALRAVAETAPNQVRHVPDVLYHWRQSPGSFSAREAPLCRDATRRALREALGKAASVAVDPALPQWPLVRFGLPTPELRITVIGGEAPDGGGLAIDSASHTSEARGDLLLFLAPGLAPLNQNWAAILAAHAMRPGVAAAGARLDGPDNRLCQAGYILDSDAIVQSPQGAADAADPGYRGQFQLARTVSALSGDCLAIRRAVFEGAGGFRKEAGDYRFADLCLRLTAQGLRCVWVPQARLRYTTQPPALSAGAAWMRKTWADKLAADPYHNPNLRLEHGRVSIKQGKIGSTPFFSSPS